MQLASETGYGCHKDLDTAKYDLKNRTRDDLDQLGPVWHKPETNLNPNERTCRNQAHETQELHLATVFRRLAALVGKTRSERSDQNDFRVMVLFQLGSRIRVQEHRREIALRLTR